MLGLVCLFFFISCVCSTAAPRGAHSQPVLLGPGLATSRSFYHSLGAGKGRLLTSNAVPAGEDPNERWCHPCCHPQKHQSRCRRKHPWHTTVWGGPLIFLLKKGGEVRSLHTRGQHGSTAAAHHLTTVGKHRVTKGVLSEELPQEVQPGLFLAVFNRALPRCCGGCTRHQLGRYASTSQYLASVVLGAAT